MNHDVAINTAALADFTLQLVGVPSPSGEERGVAALVEGEMRRLGFEVEVDRWGNVIGALRGGQGPTVLIDAHMDTVGVTDPAAWTYRPEGQRVGDRLYGRGTMDMKGALAAAIHGVALLRGQPLPGTVVISATVAEEMVEGPALRHVAQRLSPDFVIIAEATSLQLARGQRGRAEIRVETVGQVTHSARPHLGVNAAQAMVDVAVALRRLPVPTDDVLGPGILVLTDIMSRPYPALSVVPDLCLATYDRRLVPGETEDSVLGPIQQAMAHALNQAGARGHASIAVDDFCTYTGEEVRAPNFAPAWLFPEDAPVVRASLAALAAAGIEPRLTHYAFCTNGSATAGFLGIPTVGFGPGNEEFAHRVDEYVEIGDLSQAAQGYAALAEYLTAAPN